MPKETLRNRRSLTAVQKKEICLKKIFTPSLKQKDLAKEYNVSEGMVSDILKEKDRWVAIDNDSYQANLKRKKKIQFPIIEEALTVWLDKALQAKLVLTESILTTKALDFAVLCNEEKFKASNGWLDNFKKRHNLRQYNIHGEASSAPIQDLDSMRGRLRQTLRDYDPKDIFNCDETGLFWKMKLNHTISNGPVVRTKQSKDRITILLTCNSTGTEKLRPLFIHKYENSRVLKNISKNSLLVNYYWNKKSWMQVSIWNDYLKKLDSHMRVQNKNILLLVDNAQHTLYMKIQISRILSSNI